MRRIDDSSRIMGLVALTVASGLVLAGFANASGSADGAHSGLTRQQARPSAEAVAQPTRQVRVVYGGPFTSGPAAAPRPVSPPAAAIATSATPPRAVEPTAPAAPVRVASRDDSALPSVEGGRPEGAKTGIDLNTASIEELNAIGAGRIGKAIARARPYSSPEDLLAKRVLNRAAFARVKDQVTVR